MMSRHRRNVVDLSAVAIGLLIGLILAALLLPLARAQADAGPVDPVVAADHAPRPVAVVPDEPPPAAKPAPGVVDHILDVAGPVGRGALGGIACLAVAWLLARGRERWGWLRKGAAGNAAATVYAALATFGGVLAVGGSVGAGLTAVGGAMAAGMALGRDPATARREAVPPPSEAVS